MLVMPMTSQPQLAIEVALGEGRELRPLHDEVGAAAHHRDARRLRRRGEPVAQARADRMPHRHMRDAARAEEAFLAREGAVDELVDQHEAAGRQRRLERAHRRERDEVGHAGALQRVDIGAEIDLASAGCEWPRPWRGRNTTSVPPSRPKHSSSEGSPNGDLDPPPRHVGQPLDLVEPAAADDADRHAASLAAAEGRGKPIYAMIGVPWGRAADEDRRAGAGAVRCVRGRRAPRSLIPAWARSFTRRTGGAPQDLPATLLRPDGDGPFPAIVILHDCSGLGAHSSHAPARWAPLLAGEGYVVLIPDSFVPRGISRRRLHRDAAAAAAPDRPLCACRRCLCRARLSARAALCRRAAYRRDGRVAWRLGDACDPGQAGRAGAAGAAAGRLRWRHRVLSRLRRANTARSGASRAAPTIAAR